MGTMDPTLHADVSRRIVVDTSVTTLWRRREENYPAIAHRLAEMVRAVPGNCLALFPSYAFLEQIAGRLPRLEHQVLVQRQAVHTPHAHIED